LAIFVVVLGVILKSVLPEVDRTLGAVFLEDCGEFLSLGFGPGDRDVHLIAVKYDRQASK
jgi:hypothetical protein